MKSEVVWKGSKFTFEAKSRQHSLVLDANQATGGADLGPTPKELVLAAICGCSGMDVIGLLKKAKMRLDSLKITAEAETTEQHPKVFKEVKLLFEGSGEEDLGSALLDAVLKSQSLFCGVSAMMAKVCEIKYRVLLNGVKIGEGKAAFAENHR